jgi:hypothetical protein
MKIMVRLPSPGLAARIKANLRKKEQNLGEVKVAAAEGQPAARPAAAAAEVAAKRHKSAPASAGSAIAPFNATERKVVNRLLTELTEREVRTDEEFNLLERFCSFYDHNQADPEARLTVMEQLAFLKGLMKNYQDRKAVHGESAFASSSGSRAPAAPESAGGVSVGSACTTPVSQSPSSTGGAEEVAMIKQLRNRLNALRVAMFRSKGDATKRAQLEQEKNKVKEQIKTLEVTEMQRHKQAASDVTADFETAHQAVSEAFGRMASLHRGLLLMQQDRLDTEGA